MSSPCQLRGRADYSRRMKHVTFGEKTLLLGDDAADTLLEYARVLANASAADSVTLTAIGPDGNTVEVSFLVNASTELLIESTNNELPAPDNADAVREMRERINAYTRPSSAIEDDEWEDLDNNN